MTEAIATIQNLTPIGAVLVIAAVLQVGITQAAKQQSWSKQRTQAVAVAVAGVLGLLAAVVLGFIAGIPDSVVQVVCTIVLAIAIVLILGKFFYGVLGYVIPDGTTPADQGDVHVTVNSTADPEVVAQAIAEHGRRRATLVEGVVGTSAPRSTFTPASGDRSQTPEVRATHAPVEPADG